jgi:hypothetical protein
MSYWFLQAFARRKDCAPQSVPADMSAHIEESWPVPETMVDGITERLRQAIITGAIKPRERIRVADLERKFGVSHIPIREALRRLQSEATQLRGARHSRYGVRSRTLSDPVALN